MTARFPLLLIIVSLLAACAGTPPVRDADFYYREGETLFAKKRYDEAIEQLQKVKEAFASPELSAKAELRIADAHFEKEEYVEAASGYGEFRKLYPNHGQSAYALYRQGLANYNQIAGIDRDQTPVIEAATLFASFLDLYPKSEQSGDVRDKSALLRTMKARHEIYVGRFYLRTEKYTSAIGRLEGVLHDYAGEKDLDEALFYLGQAYILSGEQDKGRDSFRRLENDYPESRFLKKAAKFLARHT